MANAPGTPLRLERWAGWHPGTQPPWLRPHSFEPGNKAAVGPLRRKRKPSMTRALEQALKQELPSNPDKTEMDAIVEALIAELKLGNMQAFAVAMKWWPHVFDPHSGDEQAAEAIGMPQTQQEAAQLEHQASMVLTELGRLGFGKRELEGNAGK